jgi:hypothetical protein
LNEKDQATFCIETAKSKATSTLSAEPFLSSHQQTTACTNDQHRAYCSFLIQHSKEVYDDTLPRLPFQHFEATKTNWTYEPALWFFFGRNYIGYTNLDGRPEHTDAISHDGTWHYQLSGTKRWVVRPTAELLGNIEGPLTVSSELCIDCKEGDVLIINTGRWFHRTIIPPQRVPSVSYARDFRLGDESTEENDPSNMTNLDGLYATEDIAMGTILFTEADMPNCELHRSSVDPNCEIVEIEDGMNAVMSTRAIATGEFFCVPESSDEEYSVTQDSDSDV